MSVASVAIVAALPREIAALVRGTRPDDGLLKQGIHLHVVSGAVVVAAGMGAARATLAIASALQVAKVSALVSVGLAGGCSVQANVGDVFEAHLVIDAQTGETYRTDYGGNATLVTTSSIAGVHEKARLRDSYGALMVDMEASTVARLARMHGLEFRAIKAISDAHDFELLSLSRFATPRGHFRTGRFALHTAFRPQAWAKTMQLGRHSAKALVALTARVQAEFDLH